MHIFKKAFIVAAASCLVIVSEAQIKFPPSSSFQSIKQSFGLSEIVVEYSRPNAKGRKIFGSLVPYNKVWRTGANSTTTITFSDDVTINGKNLPAGTYGLYTIPGQQDWEILFNSETKLGANVNAYDKQKEVLRLTVAASRSPMFMESFTMQFIDVSPTTATLALTWENTVILLEIKTEIDSRIMSNIETAMKGEKPPYFQAANYYYEKNRDLDKAYVWIQKAATSMPDAYWVMALKAKIELKLNNKKAAASTAQKVIELAEKSNNPDYVPIGKELLRQAQ